ncbi:MAG: 3-isopropylmalate dehydrogenase [Deltaproteobacteria bacterium]|nr:3-isopropylmalate dehydrogenase [Deltaproteobacteria bacterium]
MSRIAVIAGDGIGVDVIREGLKVLRAADEAFKLGLEIKEFDYGAERYLKDGVALPPGQMEDFRKNWDAVYLGAMGDPRIPDMRHAKDILLAMRFELDLYINLRPVRALDDRLVPLKGKTAKDIDMTMFRENTEGLYAGMGGIFKKGTPDEIATQEDINTFKGVHRICKAAFDFAQKHGKKKVTMADKHNVLRYGHDLWERVFFDLAKSYPGITAEHMFADALGMQLIKAPENFQVIVTNNMFGDILTDVGAILQGGLGVAGSGNIHPGRVSLFEPIHGSAPKYAGKDTANPVAAIATAQMMLEFLAEDGPRSAQLGADKQGRYKKAAARIEEVVVEAIRKGKTTKDLGGTLGCAATGDWMAAAMKG